MASAERRHASIHADREIEHLTVAIRTMAAQPNMYRAALQTQYWTARLQDLGARHRLLHVQVRQVEALLAFIEAMP